MKLLLATLLTLTLLYQSLVALAPPQPAYSPSLHTTWIGETEKNRSRKS